MEQEPLAKKRKVHASFTKPYDRPPISRSADYDNNQESFKDSLFYVYDAKQKTLVSNQNFKGLTKCLMLQSGYSDAAFALKAPSNGAQINLFSMCLRFVADNLTMVDCLEGFPSIVGEVLFTECVKREKFNAKKEPCKDVETGLVLFAKSYPEYMIEKLNLANKKLVFKSLQNVLSFCHIQSLNLSNCGLMTLEANLADLLKVSQMTLKHLSLSSNGLDENFVKMFTLPQRLGYVDYRKLEYLDLTNNSGLTKPSDLNLKYFGKYESLAQIIVSWNQSSSHKKTVKDNDPFKICSCKPHNSSCEVENAGWVTRLSMEDLVSVAELSNERHLSSVEGL
jgi:hypothetical protein